MQDMHRATLRQQWRGTPSVIACSHWRCRRIWRQIVEIVAEIGDYSLRCGQGLRRHLGGRNIAALTEREESVHSE